MPVNSETNAAQGQTTLLEGNAPEGVYASLFEKINLKPVSEMSALDIWQDAQAMSDATADERLTAGMQVFLECLTKSGSKVEKLDKNLIDHHIAELDYQISRQLDAVMHSEEFQAVESLWRGVKSLVDKTDFRQNVKVELLDMSKEDLRQDFEDSPEIIQSGLYKHTYIDEYDTPGGEPIAALISAYEFDASAQDVALLRNISKVSAAAHMPFNGSAGPKFFLKDSMEEVAAIKDIGNYFDRAEYIKWKSFRETDDARYIGLVMPRVLGRLPYGPDTVPVRSFNYVEEVKGPDHDKYLWTNASFAFAANMVRSFINNGWCVQIRGPQAGGAVQDLPIHLYDLGTGRLPPDWNLAYSRKLTQQAQELWPEQAKPLAKKWQQRLNAAALPTEQLDGWHQGMMKLKQLSDRLNGLDEQKGKYMTVSELKSVVFSTMQSFNKSVPAEEQMRVLLQNPEREPLPAAARAQLEMHLKQLTARYAEIQENAESPGA